MKEDCQLILNTVAVIRRYAPRDKQWLAKQNNMLAKMEHLNRQLLYTLRLEEPCSIDDASKIPPHPSELENSRVIGSLWKHKQPAHPRASFMHSNKTANLPDKSKPSTSQIPSMAYTSSLPARNSEHPVCTAESTRFPIPEINGRNANPHEVIQSSSANAIPSSTHHPSGRGGYPNNRRRGTSSYRRPRGTRGFLRGRGRGGRQFNRGSRNQAQECDCDGDHSSIFDTSQDDSDASSIGVCGFTRSQQEELLCQGIKPWDPEAWSALSVLYGWDFY